MPMKNRLALSERIQAWSLVVIAEHFFYTAVLDVTAHRSRDGRRVQHHPQRPAPASPQIEVDISGSSNSAISSDVGASNFACQRNSASRDIAGCSIPRR